MSFFRVFWKEGPRFLLEAQVQVCSAETEAKSCAGEAGLESWRNRRGNWHREFIQEYQSKVYKPQIVGNYKSEQEAFYRLEKEKVKRRMSYVRGMR